MEIVFFSLKIIFVLANSVDPDEMLHYSSGSLLFVKIRIQESLVYKRLIIVILQFLFF